MIMSGRTEHGRWAWLLCVLLFWLTASPPHCDLCDGVSVVVTTSDHPALKHSHPLAPDSCNGICTCCGLYGLPNGEDILVPVNVALARIAGESPRPAMVPSSTIFR